MRFVKELDLDIKPSTLANWLVGANKDHIVATLVSKVKKVVESGVFDPTKTWVSAFITVDIRELVPDLSADKLEAITELFFILDLNTLLRDNRLYVTVFYDTLTVNYNGTTMLGININITDLNHQFASALHFHGVPLTIQYECGLDGIVMRSKR